MKPKSYHEQNCCGNCQYVFIKSEYDEFNEFYCNYDNISRPLCGSVGMREDYYNELINKGIDINNLEEYEKLIMKWVTWKKDKEVSESGICDKFIPKS